MTNLTDPQVSLAFSTLKRNVKHLEELVSMVLKENTVEAGASTEKLVRRQFDLWPHVEADLPQPVARRRARTAPR